MFLHSALVIAQIVAAAPAPNMTELAPAAPPTAEVSPEAARSEEARQFYANQEYVRAAQAYELLYRDVSAAKYLFNAAAAREAAGHDAHAYVALQRYLDHPGLTADERARAEARLASLRNRTTAIQIRLTPTPRPSGLAVVLSRADVEPLQLDSDALDALDRRGIIEIWAEVGTWMVEAEAPGHRKSQVSLESIAGASQTLELTLAPALSVNRQAEAKGSVVVRIGARKLPTDLSLLFRRDSVLLREIPTELESTWEIPTGTWYVGASSRDFVASPVPADVSRDKPLTVSLALQRTTASKLKLGIGGASAGTLGVLGIYLAVQSSSTELSRGPDSLLAMKFSAGASLGLALGFGAGAMIMHARKLSERTRISTTAGVGAGLAACGGIILAVVLSTRSSDSGENVRRFTSQELNGYAALAGLTSSGLGLILSNIFSTRASRQQLKRHTRQVNR